MINKLAILSAILFVALAFKASAGQLNASEGNLTAWFTMDDANTKLTDNKTRTDLGQFNATEGTGSTATYRQAGLVNYSSFSVAFDGNDHFFNKSINENIGFGGGNGITVEGWINISSLTTGQDIISTRSPGGIVPGWFFRLQDYGGGDLRLSCQAENGAIDSNFGNEAVDPTYMHFVCIFNSTTVAMYRNVTQGTTAAWTPEAVDKGSNLTIGKDNEVDARYFRGILDEWRIWNRSLGELELKHLMANGINTSVESGAVSDTTKPIINGTLNASVIGGAYRVYVVDYINYSVNWTEETAAAYGNITLNCSVGGTRKINFSGLSGTSGTFSNSTRIQDCFVAGDTGNYTGFLTDTSGNVQQNSSKFLVNSTQTPTDFEGINNSNPRQGEVVNVSDNTTDIIALSACQIGHNQSGVFSTYNFTLSGLSDQCSQNITIGDSAGSRINFSTKITDIFGNFNMTSILVTVAANATGAAPQKQSINILRRGNTIGGREILKVLT